MMNPLMAITGVSVVLVGVFFGLWKWEASDHKDTIAEAAEKLERSQANALKLEVSLEEANASVERQAKLYGAERESRIRVEAKFTVIEKDMTDAQSKLDSYRGRWANASKKAGLLSRLANRATAKRVQFFSAATCRTDCAGDESSGSNAGTASEAEPDPGS